MKNRFQFLQKVTQNWNLNMIIKHDGMIILSMYCVCMSVCMCVCTSVYLVAVRERIKGIKLAQLCET